MPKGDRAIKPMTKWPWIIKTYPWIVLSTAIIGFVSSMILTIEKFELAKNPDHHLSCSINPLLSCGPIIDSDQASVFGFPNPILGLFGFAVLICFAMVLFTGALQVKKLPVWFTRTLMLSVAAGFAFCLWLMAQAFWVLGALCLYCMIVWAVVSVLMLYTPLWILAVREPNLEGASASVYRSVRKNHFGVYLLWFLIVLGTIVLTFRDYFESLI